MLCASRTVISRSLTMSFFSSACVKGDGCAPKKTRNEFKKTGSRRRVQEDGFKEDGFKEDGFKKTGSRRREGGLLEEWAQEEGRTG